MVTYLVKVPIQDERMRKETETISSTPLQSFIQEVLLKNICPTLCYSQGREMVRRKWSPAFR